ncbi:hypothetical protein P8625_08305 [Tenacibaculum tangerinum]|uniref:Uncharacterized protein n=1 Tax=Tenacibaculum tangerinum TaxID=3038772 RepID=A0ABY8KY00_9FLAO|nr:hypothetical protein [Tenacibaculum tangerinum]WGH74123.1 hypothetical protein P8625_08305 [Tenacibaculum tangerinum]
MKKFLILLAFSGVLFSANMLTKTETAEASLDEWKSTTVECTATKTVGWNYIITYEESTTYQATMRKCVSSWGLCTWNSSCS